MTAVSNMSKTMLRATRTQAIPHTVDVVSDLLSYLSSSPRPGPSCNGLVLAFGCLIYAGLDRSHPLTLGKDSIHNITRRFKNRDQPTAVDSRLAVMGQLELRCNDRHTGQDRLAYRPRR